MKQQVIQKPLIWLNLTHHAFINAVGEYNKKNEASNDKIKDTHISLFYTLINRYNTSITNISTAFQESPYSPVHNKPVKDWPFLEVNTAALGKYFDRNGKTISARLKRLEKANFIDITFHGSKRPLSIQFSDDILKVIDLQNLDISIINPKFVTDWELIAPIDLGKKADDKKEYTRTYLKYKNKQSGVDFIENETIKRNSQKLTSLATLEDKAIKSTLSKASLQEHEESVKAKIRDFENNNASPVNASQSIRNRNSGEAGKKNENKNERFVEKEEDYCADFEQSVKIVEKLNQSSRSEMFAQKNLMPIRRGRGQTVHEPPDKIKIKPKSRTQKGTAAN